jgi:hypothetical protein
MDQNLWRSDIWNHSSGGGYRSTYRCTWGELGETGVRLPFSPDKLGFGSAKLLGGGPVRVDREGGFELEQLGNVLRPACIQFHVI